MSTSCKPALALAVSVMLCCGVMTHAQQTAPASTNATEAASKPSDAAPAFTLKTLNGGQLHLADYKGKVVLLNFWATYCTPCKTETPWFVELQKKYAADGLQVIGITMDEPDNKRLPKFVADMGVNYPIAFGDYDVADSYHHVQALPATFLIARDGTIAKEIHGIESKEKLEDEITKLLSVK